MPTHPLRSPVSYWAISALALFSALYTMSLNACATAAAKISSVSTEDPLIKLVERYRLHDGS